jgi:hypothetical protein
MAQVGEIIAIITSNLIYVTIYLGIVLFLISKTSLDRPLMTCLIVIFLIGSIFKYGNYRCQHPDIKDPLQKPLFKKLPWLDGWAYTHFMAFFFIGLFTGKIPYWVVLVVGLGLGIVWEVFEHVVGKERPGWMGAYGGCDLATDKNGDGNWWFGKWTDLLMNATGMLLGIALSKLF